MWHNKVLQNCQSKCNKTTLKLCLAMYHNALLLMSMLSIDQSIYGITLKMKASLGQGSYTNGQLKFQDFSRTFQVNILKNPGPDEG